MLQANDATQEKAPVLAVRDVSHSYGAKRALDHVSFELMPGRFMALLGPNGAGKTTLFSLITRLFDTRHGKIEIAGVDLKASGSRALEPLGVVFQQPTLDLDLTVQQNLAYFAALRGLSRAQAKKRMMQSLEALSMAERIDERVRSLNGGHRRRVEIARALLHNPRVLLLDEATVGLDVPARQAIVSHVHQLAAEHGVAVLWATHLIDEIEPTDDLIVLHQGRIRAKGRADQIMRANDSTDLEHTFRHLIGDVTTTSEASL